jgi:hypothetical protein
LSINEKKKISFKIVSLGMYTAIPSFSFRASKAPWKSFSVMLLSTAWDYIWMSKVVSKCHPFSFIFNLANNVKTQGAKSSKYGGWGTITMLLVTNSAVFRDV